MRYHFTKMQGLGNDFAVIDFCSGDIKRFPTPGQIKRMSSRHFGIGFDQLLVIEPSKLAGIDFLYHVFNADGSSAGQSGNGVRCVAKYVYLKGLTQKRDLVLSIKSRLVTVRLEDDEQITVNLGKPITEPKQIPFVAKQASLRYQLPLDNIRIEIGAISVGNPHAVLLVGNVKSAPVDSLGPKIEKHLFFPEKANVDFMEIVDRKTIKLRVFERGTGETMSCGSGASASVVMGRLWGLLDERVTVQFPSGDLIIEWKDKDSSIFLTGPAEMVFEGIWNCN